MENIYLNDTAIHTIRKFYKGIRKALDEAEIEYNKNKRSVKAREAYQFIAGQEMAISDLCSELGIELVDEDLNVLE
jgi:hypothetical protein